LLKEWYLDSKTIENISFNVAFNMLLFFGGYYTTSLSHCSAKMHELTLLYKPLCWVQTLIYVKFQTLTFSRNAAWNFMHIVKGQEEWRERQLVLFYYSFLLIVNID